MINPLEIHKLSTTTSTNSQNFLSSIKDLIYNFSAEITTKHEQLEKKLSEDYEKIITKLESDIRKHLQVHFQFKIHNESLVSKATSLEEENKDLANKIEILEIQLAKYKEEIGILEKRILKEVESKNYHDTINESIAYKVTTIINIRINIPSLTLRVLIITTSSLQ